MDARQQERVQQLALQALQEGQPYQWFETLYQQAQGDPAQVPWARLAPHPCLQDWLSPHPETQGRALVVGCGLGDDAELLQAHGFQVTGFDISATAIAWCQQRFPNSQVNY
jgi:SAM-dependent methyltransferase